jgi:hypothetical protein
MTALPESLHAWGTPQFNTALKRELESLRVEQLPLQQGLVSGSYVLDDKHSVMIISVDEAAVFIRAKVGVFFSGIIAGCSCADDPTPVEALNEYCELWVEIDKRNGEAKISLVSV